MLPNKNSDEYTRYCITPEGKEYLRRMLEEKNSGESGELNEEEFELNMNEEIDFENLQIFDDEDEIEPDEDEIIDNDIISDEFFRLNLERSDDACDFWKENLC